MQVFLCLSGTYRKNPDPGRNSGRCEDSTRERVAYIGDDLTDIVVMRRVGLSFATANARDEVKQVAHYVTQATGGSGAVREVCELILKAKEPLGAAAPEVRSSRIRTWPSESGLSSTPSGVLAFCTRSPVLSRAMRATSRLVDILSSHPPETRIYFEIELPAENPALIEDIRRSSRGSQGDGGQKREQDLRQARDHCRRRSSGGTGRDRRDL